MNVRFSGPRDKIRWKKLRWPKKTSNTAIERKKSRFGLSRLAAVEKGGPSGRETDDVGAGRAGAEEFMVGLCAMQRRLEAAAPEGQAARFGSSGLWSTPARREVHCRPRWPYQGRACK
jgi:hypothetical protein